MPYEHFRMDTSSMSVEHRNELLTAINNCTGVGWANWTGEPFIFKLTWDNEYDFHQFIPYTDEISLEPWGFF